MSSKNSTFCIFSDNCMGPFKRSLQGVLFFILSRSHPLTSFHLDRPSSSASQASFLHCGQKILIMWDILEGMMIQGNNGSRLGKVEKLEVSRSSFILG